MKRLMIAAGAASALLFSCTAFAQQPNLVNGWNLVKPTNCVFEPGSPATGTPPSSATPDTMYIYVDVMQGAPPPGSPPPPPDAGEFSTNDPTEIAVSVPFCKDGTQFWVYWNNNKAQYFSISPH